MKKSPKKEAILNAAEQLFYQHGFHAIGVKAILEQAEVAPMTMYYHFKSKEDVIKEVLVRRENKYFDLLEGKLIKNENTQSYISSLIQAHMDWLEAAGSNGCLLLRAKQEYEGINEDITSLSKEHKKSLLTRIENDLELLGAAGSLGIQLNIILEGLTSVSQVLTADDLNEAAADLVRSIQIA